MYSFNQKSLPLQNKELYQFCKLLEKWGVHFSLFLIIGKLNWETYKQPRPRVWSQEDRKQTNFLEKFSNFRNNSIEMQNPGWRLHVSFDTQ